jgi:N utilization substance protein B
MKKRITPVAAEPEKPVISRKKGSAKAKKTAARLAAVQVLYQIRLNNQDADEALKDFLRYRVGYNLDGDVFVPPDEDMLQMIVTAATDRWMEVEEHIAAATKSRKSEPEVLLSAILRAGVAEMIAQPETDAGIIINDFMNVTNGFYDGDEVKLVNAVLDKVGKVLRA